MKKKLIAMIILFAFIISNSQVSPVKAEPNTFTLYPYCTLVPLIVDVSKNVFQYGAGKKLKIETLESYNSYSREYPTVKILNSKNQLVKNIQAYDSNYEEYYYSNTMFWDGKDSKKKYVKDGNYKIEFKVSSKTIYKSIVVKKKLSKSDISKNKYNSINLPGLKAKYPSTWTVSGNENIGIYYLKSPKVSGQTQSIIRFNIYDYRTLNLTDSFINAEYPKYINSFLTTQTNGKLIKTSSAKLAKLSAKLYSMEMKASISNGIITSKETSYIASMQKYSAVSKGIGYDLDYIYTKGKNKYQKDFDSIRKSIVFSNIGINPIEMITKLSGDVDFWSFKTTIPNEMYATITSYNIMYNFGNPINSDNNFNMQLFDNYYYRNLDEVVESYKERLEEESAPGVVPVVSDLTICGKPAKLIVSKIYDETLKVALEYGAYIFKVNNRIYIMTYDFSLEGNTFSKEKTEYYGLKVNELISSIEAY